METFLALLAVGGVIVGLMAVAGRPSQSARRRAAGMFGDAAPAARIGQGTPPQPVAIDSPAPATWTDLLPALDGLEDKGWGAPPSERQLAALSRVVAGPVPDTLTDRQASAVLSARAYAEVVIRGLIGTDSAYPDEQRIEAAAAAFIVRDPDLLKRAVQWNARSWSRNDSGRPPTAKRDRHYDKVEEFLGSLLKR